MNKKQAVFIRIPGINGYSAEFQQKLSEQIRITLQQQFTEKEVVVLLFNDDIHFCNEGEIRDLIEKMENMIK